MNKKVVALIAVVALFNFHVGTMNVYAETGSTSETSSYDYNQNICYDSDEFENSELQSLLDAVDDTDMVKSVTKIYNVPIRFIFDDGCDIDEMLEHPDFAHGKNCIYMVENINGEMMFYDKQFNEMPYVPVSFSNPDSEKIPPVNIPENAKTAFFDKDFAKKYISADAETLGVYYLYGETNRMGTAICYKTSVGDYVYYAHYAVGEKLFPVADFCDYQKAISDYYAQFPESGGGSIENIHDLSAYEIKDISGNVADNYTSEKLEDSELQSILDAVDDMDAVKSVTKIYNVPIRFIFDDGCDIDEMLEHPDFAHGKNCIYMVENINGEMMFYDKQFNEMLYVPVSFSNPDSEKIPPVNIPENAKKAFFDKDFSKKYISADAETFGVYYLYGETNQMGTAICYKTSVGDYVYYAHYAVGEKLFPVADFCDYQKAISDYYAQFPESGGGNIENIRDLSAYEIKDISGNAADTSESGDVILTTTTTVHIVDTTTTTTATNITTESSTTSSTNTTHSIATDITTVPTTSIPTDTEEELPQTGYSNLYKVLVGIASTMTVTGTAMIARSKKKDEE